MRFKIKRYLLGILLCGFLLISLKTYSTLYDLDDSTSKVDFIWKAPFPSMQDYDQKPEDKRIGLHELGVQGKNYTSTTCQFPRLSLYNDANKDAFEKLEPLLCSIGNDLFYIENGIVKLNHSVLKSQEQNVKNLQKCEYLAVERVNDDYFTFTEPVVKKEPPFDLIIQHDFIQVRCNLIDPEEKDKEKIATKSRERRDGKDREKNTTDPVYDFDEHSEMFGEEDFLDSMATENFDFDQFLVQVYPKPEVLKRTSIVPENTGTGLNVIMIGLDSMSHMSYQRLLPQTYSLLRDELDFTILNGYNIVGDATTAALIPILTGKTEMELPETRKDEIDSGYVDVYPFIWNKFKDHGYATMFAEDEPSINAFNLRLNGFNHQPTDHYMRPFWQAIWQSTLQDISSKYCNGRTPHHQYMLGYLKDFILKYKEMPKFAFLFMGEQTHWRNDPGQYVDSDFASFLKWLKHSGELEKSVVIVMADHGARYGKVRKTVQGKIEERMPMMAIRYPNKFLKRYPQVLKNLKLNQNRLSSPFDIYETLAALLDKSAFSNPFSIKQRGISLSREIPFNRTCKDAGIDIHWCSCMIRQQQNVENEYVKKSADAIITYINRLTLPVRKLCKKLELKEIKSAYIVIPNEKVLKFVSEKDDDYRYANFSNDAKLDIAHYEITIETWPQIGVFEATVVISFKDGSVRLHPHLSRLDRYGDQSSCIKKRYPDLLKYCLCKNFEIQH